MGGSVWELPGNFLVLVPPTYVGGHRPQGGGLRRPETSTLGRYVGNVRYRGPTFPFQRAFTTGIWAESHRRRRKRTQERRQLSAGLPGQGPTGRLSGPGTALRAQRSETEDAATVTSGQVKVCCSAEVC